MHVKRGLTCRFCFTSLIEMLVRVRSLGTSKLLSKNIVQIVHYVSFLFPRLLLFDEHKRFIARYLVDERVTLGKSIIKCRSVYLLILLLFIYIPETRNLRYWLLIVAYLPLLNIIYIYIIMRKLQIRNILTIN